MEPPLCSLFLLGALAVTRARAGSHSLRYFYTAWSGAELGGARFVSVGYVDDREFVRFDSAGPGPRAEPRAAWMARVEAQEPGYWARETRLGRADTQIYREGLDNVRGYHNQSRGDPPSARVTRHTAPHGEVTLRCRAQDFYPSEISLTWLKDGEEQLQDTEFIETRPGGDGTFQKWAAVGVPPGQEGSYSCRVQHQGLAEPLSLKWEPPSSSIWTLLGVIVGVLLLTAVTAGVVIWKKNSGAKGRAYAPAAA